MRGVSLPSLIALLLPAINLAAAAALAMASWACVAVSVPSFGPSTGAMLSGSAMASLAELGLATRAGGVASTAGGLRWASPAGVDGCWKSPCWVTTSGGAGVVLGTAAGVDASGEASLTDGPPKKACPIKWYSRNIFFQYSSWLCFCLLRLSHSASSFGSCATSARNRRTSRSEISRCCICSSTCAR